MHETRRRVLRVFRGDPTPKTTRDLMATLPRITLQTMTYHVLVLENCGSLTVSRVEQAGGSITRSYISNAGDNAEIVAALHATERLDDFLR
jgi:hypothetical protein